jgi:hypothetical protein
LRNVGYVRKEGDEKRNCKKRNRREKGKKDCEEREEGMRKGRKEI